MILADVLNFVIDDGIESLRLRCAGHADRMRFEGGRDGFEACRGKEPGEIRELLAEAGMRRMAARESGDPEYLRIAWYEAQVQHVAAVMSAALYHQNLPPIVTVTVRSMARYAEIVGIDK